MSRLQVPSVPISETRARGGHIFACGLASHAVLIVPISGQISSKMGRFTGIFLVSARHYAGLWVSRETGPLRPLARAAQGRCAPPGPSDQSGGNRSACEVRPTGEQPGRSENIAFYQSTDRCQCDLADTASFYTCSASRARASSAVKARLPDAAAASHTITVKVPAPPSPGLQDTHNYLA